MNREYIFPFFIVIGFEFTLMYILSVFRVNWNITEKKLNGSVGGKSSVNHRRHFANILNLFVCNYVFVALRALKNAKVLDLSTLLLLLPSLPPLETED